MANMPNDFWSGWIITLTVVSLAAVAWLLFTVYFSPRALEEEKEIEENGPVWDEDIHEGHAAPPMWWFWGLFLALVFTAGYLMLYPGLGSYKGALEWSADGRIKSAYEGFEERFQPQRDEIAARSLDELREDPGYMKTAETLFRNNCAVCHGANAQGQANLFPSLIDEEWLWGDSAQAIEHSIRHGRNGAMPGWGNVLSGRQLRDMTDYVIKLGQESTYNHPAETTYQQFCSTCHSPDGRGNQLMGAPDLTNDIWLYGGDVEAVTRTILWGRNGEMPAFEGRLNDTQIKLLVAWLTGDRSQDTLVQN